MIEKQFLISLEFATNHISVFLKENWLFHAHIWMNFTVWFQNLLDTSLSFISLTDGSFETDPVINFAIKVLLKKWQSSIWKQQRKHSIIVEIWSENVPVLDFQNIA